jgi:hypothetical protein
MFFWHKRSTITLDCFTYLETTALNHPITRAGKFYPEELRDLPKSVSKKISTNPRSNIQTELLTVKSCNGLTDLYRNGFVLPAWDTFDLEMLGESNFLINNPNGFIKGEYHHRDQYNNDIFKGYAHVKLLSPWYIKEKSGVQFVWMHPMWNRSDNIQNLSILPAVIDFKKQHSSHVNTFIKIGSIISFNAGDPLVHMIPISDKKIKINIHCVSEQEWMKEKFQMDFHSHLLNHRNLEIPEIFKNKKKCPFGF